MARTFYNKFNPDCRCCNTEQYIINNHAMFIAVLRAHISSNLNVDYRRLIEQPELSYSMLNSPLATLDPTEHLLTYHSDPNLQRISPGYISNISRMYSNLHPERFFNSNPLTPPYHDSDFPISSKLSIESLNLPADSLYTLTNTSFPPNGLFLNKFSVYEAALAPRPPGTSGLVYYDPDFVRRLRYPSDSLDVFPFENHTNFANNTLLPWGIIDIDKYEEYFELIWENCPNGVIPPVEDTFSSIVPGGAQCPKRFFGYTRLLILLVDDYRKYLKTELLDWFLNQGDRRLFIFSNNRENHANQLLEELNVPIRYTNRWREHVYQAGEVAFMDHANLVPDSPGAYLYPGKSRLLTRGSWDLENGEAIAEYGPGVSMAYYKRGKSEVWVSGSIDNMMTFLPANIPPTFVTPQSFLTHFMYIGQTALAEFLPRIHYDAWAGFDPAGTPLVCKGSYGIQLNDQWPDHEQYVTMKHFIDRFRAIPVP